MNKYCVSYTSFAGESPRHGSKTVHAKNAREAMDNLELQHPEFSTTSARKIR